MRKTGSNSKYDYFANKRAILLHGSAPILLSIKVLKPALKQRMPFKNGITQLTTTLASHSVLLSVYSAVGGDPDLLSVCRWCHWSPGLPFQSVAFSVREQWRHVPL